MDIEECFEKQLLKRDKPDKNKALKSIEISKHKLDLAKRESDAKIFESSIISAYSSMFHSARALLFKDGVREKSHFGLYIYIKEAYKDRLEPRFINELNTLRLERHELLYGLEAREVEEAEAENIIKIARDFIIAIKKLFL